MVEGKEGGGKHCVKRGFDNHDNGAGANHSWWLNRNLGVGRRGAPLFLIRPLPGVFYGHWFSLWFHFVGAFKVHLKADGTF